MASEIVEIKKLSVKEVIGDVKKILRGIENDKDGVDLYLLGGVATGFSTGTGTYGDWTKIQGDFLCHSLIDGRRFSAPACFVQEPVQGYLLNALSNATEVEFTVKVRLMRDDSVAIGYTYILTPVLNAEQTDKLEKVRSRMSEVLAKYLPAPKEDDTGVGEPEEIPAPKRAGGKK